MESEHEAEAIRQTLQDEVDALWLMNSVEEAEALLDQQQINWIS